MLVFALITVSSAQAAELVLANVSAKGISADIVSTSFKMDRTTGEGAVSVAVYDERCTTHRGSEPGDREEICHQFTEYAKSFAVAGLKLDNEQVVFADDSGEVVCGNYGVSRVLRRRTLFLTGNCNIDVDITKIEGERRLIVKFLTR